MVYRVISKNYLNILMEQQFLHFLKISFAPSATVFLNNLVLYSKDFKLWLLAIPSLKLVASSIG